MPDLQPRKPARPSTANAGAWNAIDIVVRQGFNFVAMLVLARLLAPDSFGIIALVSFFSSIAIAVLQTGIATALIQKEALSEAEESAAFWWNVIASCAVAGLLMVAAPWIATYYDYAILKPLMAVAAVQIILASLVSVQSALLARRLRFVILAKAGIASTLVSGLLAIAAAVTGAGVWSLGLQLVAAAILNTLIVWRLSEWRPRAHLNFGTLKPLLGFGGYLGISSFLEVLYTQGFAVIVGKRYGASDLGLYNRGMALQLVPSSAVALIVGRIALPLFAQQSDEQQKLLPIFRRLTRLTMFVNVPMMSGLAVLADQIVVALYGQSWAPAGPILGVLSVGGIFLPLHALNLQLLLAQGRADAFFWIEVAKKIVGITCIVIGSFYGLLGLAYGTLIANLLALFINTFMTKRTLQYGLLAQLGDLLGIFVCSGAMVLVILVLRTAISLPLWWSLPLLVIVGAGIYFALAATLGLTALRETLELVSASVGKRPTVVEG